MLMIARVINDPKVRTMPRTRPLLKVGLLQALRMKGLAQH